LLPSVSLRLHGAELSVLLHGVFRDEQPAPAGADALVANLPRRAERVHDGDGNAEHPSNFPAGE
jgi:hypothetical protein